MNILIQNLNDKFINNLAITNLNDTNIYKADINNILYSIHYSKNIDHVIFCASLFTNEVQQYIAEFFQKVKIFIYHDTEINLELIELYKNTCYHLLQSTETKNHNLIPVPNLLNHNLYRQSISNKKIKHEIVCFLDNLKTIPEKLKTYLYPNTQYKIKLFNNPKIQHQQNLGILTEYDKSKILSETKYFIPINNNYIIEAFMSGCVLLDLDELHDLIPKKYIDKPNYTTYETFLRSILKN